MNKRICTICARGGSKGVPGKNIKELLGKPLLAYSIETARKTKLFDIIAVSSDDPDILSVAKEYGPNLLISRPSSLASDFSGKIPAIRHCFLEAERLSKESFDTIVDLDVTSPLRSVEDIKNSLAIFESEKSSNLITGCQARRSPYFNMIKLKDKKYASLVINSDEIIKRRQDTPECFDMNASIYIWKKETLLYSDNLFHSDTLFFEMPEERSIDIDSELDFKIVSTLMSERI